MPDSLPPRTAVVVGLPRAATTLMCDAIAQHPQVLGFGELFSNQQLVREQYHAERLGDTDGAYKGNLPQYIQTLYNVTNHLGKELLVWKLLDDQEPLCWKYIEDHPEVSIVYIQRQNVVEAWVSAAASRESGVWHGVSAGNIKKASEIVVKIDPEEIVALDNRKAVLEATLAALPNRLHTVRYSVYTTRFESCMAEIFNFLEVDPFTPKLSQAKLNQRPLPERVSNYTELVEYFKGSPLAKYLPPL